MANADNLIVKYRPSTWEDVVGHAEVVKSLRKRVEERNTHVFLFTGSAGLGKTTFGRLIAKYLGAKDTDLDEIDAATYTGIDDARGLVEGLRYRPLGDSEIKVIILDEMHALSKQASTSLLKSIEEPPDWVYWILCTTEPTRVPETIKQRAAHYALNPVSKRDLFDLLDDICEKEGFIVPSSEVLDLCVKQAHGSPRQAISNLAVCCECSDRQEAAELLHAAEAKDASDARDLALALIKGNGWEIIHPILKSIEKAKVDPESVRIVIREYVSKVIMGTESASKVAGLFTVLSAFSTPFQRLDGMAALLLACADVVFTEG